MSTGGRVIKPLNNNTGSLGSSLRVWANGYFNTLTVTDATVSGVLSITGNIEISGTLATGDIAAGGIRIANSMIVFEGSSADEHELFIMATTPTADRVVNLPDNSGTVALTSDIPTSLSFDGSTTDGICTYKDADEISVESALTFVGNLLLQIGTASNNTTMIIKRAEGPTNMKGGGLSLQGGNVPSDNFEGGDVEILGGFGKGTGDGGTIKLATHASGLAGSTNNSNQDYKATLSGDGYFTLDVDYFKILSATADDYFYIYSGTHGATTIATIDDAGTDADLTLDIDGNIELNADGGEINFKDSSAQLAKIDTDGLSFVDNPGANIVFEGTTDDAHQTTLTPGEPTGDRTVTLPDATGTVALTSDITNTTLNGTTAGGIATYASANTLDIESGLTWDGDHLMVTSSGVSDPTLTLRSTTNDNKGATLRFIGDKGAAGADGDYSGMIDFSSDNSAQEEISFAMIQGKVGTAADTDESGVLQLRTAASDGTTSLMRTGIEIAGRNNADVVDVDLGYGTSSETNIVGSMKFQDSAAEITSTGQHIHKQVKVVLSTSDCNSLHTTPIELIPAQGANTIIVPGGGIIMVDRAAPQSNSLADMNLHYGGQEPGAYGTSSIFHWRRIMYGVTTDVIVSIGELTGFRIADTLTEPVNQPVEVSVDSALSSNCMTSITIYLSYHVIDIS